jgi:hypothetical protein
MLSVLKYKNAVSVDEPKEELILTLKLAQGTNPQNTHLPMRPGTFITENTLSLSEPLPYIIPLRV